MSRPTIFIVTGLTSLLLLVCGAASASAQTFGGWQLSAGYSAMRDITDHATFPTGWNVSGAAPVTRWLAVVADVDGHTDTIPSFGSDIRLASHAVAAGARLSARLGPFTEFGQLLVGTVRSTGTLFGTTDTTRHTIVQPGVGLDYPLSRHLAARGEFDARWIHSGQEVRLVVGLVYRVR